MTSSTSIAKRRVDHERSFRDNPGSNANGCGCIAATPGIALFRLIASPIRDQGSDVSWREASGVERLKRFQTIKADARRHIAIRTRLVRSSMVQRLPSLRRRISFRTSSTASCRSHASLACAATSGWPLASASATIAKCRSSKAGVQSKCFLLLRIDGRFAIPGRNRRLPLPSRSRYRALCEPAIQILAANPHVGSNLHKRQFAPVEPFSPCAFTFCGDAHQIADPQQILR